MWEFCVRAQRTNNDIIEYIFDSVEQAVRDANGVATVVTLGDFCELVLACPFKAQPKIKGLLHFVLCTVFTEKLKYKFLHNNITLLEKNCEYFNAFVKVLTYFDSDFDRGVVSRVLCLNKRIVLESFLEFKLRLIKNKWKELCRLTNDNATLFISSETFVELLKFLIANIDPKYELVTIEFKEKTSIYIGERTHNKLIKSFEENDEVGLLTSLIDFSPRKLKLKGNIKNNKMIALLHELFGAALVTL